MSLLDVAKLCRVRQWYKNIVIFVPILFSGSLFNTDLFFSATLAFFSLCFISAAYYIANDLADIERDKLDESKSNRPLASGAVTKRQAKALLAVFLAIGAMIALGVSVYFFLLAILLFVLTQLYTAYLKNFVFVDSISIAMNFVVKAISGVFVINVVEFSPWIIISMFFLALLLAFGKRKAELALVKDATDFKPVLKYYDNQTLGSLIAISSTVLFLGYSLYAALERQALLITLPVALYLVMYYVYITNNEPEFAKNPEKCFRKRNMALAFVLWTCVTVLALYI